MSILALDLDGTLLNHEKHISPRSRAALQRAADAGHFIVPATGRALNAMPKEVLEQPFVRYVISINGACVSDRMTGEILLRREIPMETALRVLAFATRYDCMRDVYWNHTGWTNRDYLERLRYYNSDEEVVQLIRATRHPVEDVEAFLREKGERVQKVQLCFRNMDEREQAWREIGETFPEIVVTSSFRNNLELNAAGADKGAALRLLAKHLGLAEDDTYAFGDSTNDLAMLNAAGTGIVMGNAADAIKAQGDAVTDTNDNDGVAKFIEDTILSL